MKFLEKKNKWYWKCSIKWRMGYMWKWNWTIKKMFDEFEPIDFKLDCRSFEDDSDKT